MFKKLWNLLIRKSAVHEIESTWLKEWKKMQAEKVIKTNVRRLIENKIADGFDPITAGLLVCSQLNAQDDSGEWTINIEEENP